MQQVAYQLFQMKYLFPSRKDKLSGRSMVTAHMQRKQEMKPSFTITTRLRIKALVNRNLNEL